MTTASLAHPRAHHRDASADRLVQAWLACVAALVMVMIIVGGATRLTDSGLSITEWQPLLGAIPPLSDSDWQLAFAKYQTIPQYQSVNKGMGLDAFKDIFWWEWAHRFLGRFIGLAFALPLAGFWLTGRIRAGWAPRLLGVLALGGIQGALGWYMVKSGLADRIDVSPNWLALHLSVAFTLLGCLVWLILDLAPTRTEPWLQTLTAFQRATAFGLVPLVFSQVALGGLVAGLKAGRAFNTWPLMDGRLIPDGFGRLEPWWRNLNENMATVQFNHRLAAYLIVALGLWHTATVIRAADDERVRVSGGLLALGLVSQMTLGIATVLAAVPIGLGVAHQGLAAVVLVLAVWHAHTVAGTSLRRR